MTAAKIYITSRKADTSLHLGPRVNDKSDPEYGRRLFEYRWTHGDSGKTGFGHHYVNNEAEARRLLLSWNDSPAKGNWHYEPLKYLPGRLRAHTKKSMRYNEKLFLGRPIVRLGTWGTTKQPKVPTRSAKRSNVQAVQSKKRS